MQYIHIFIYIDIKLINYKIPILSDKILQQLFSFNQYPKYQYCTYKQSC